MEFEFERLLSRVKPLKDTEIQIHFPLFKSKPHLFLFSISQFKSVATLAGMFPQAREEVAILLGLSKSSVEVMKVNQSFWGIVAEVCWKTMKINED